MAALARGGYGEGAAIADRLDAAADGARTGKDYSSATATPRRDMNPLLAARLGIDTGRSLTAAEVANLLNGQRADGGDIPGKQVQAATEAVGATFGLDERRMPTRVELEHILAGRRADGAELPQTVAEGALRRFQAVLGAKNRALSPEQRAHILDGRTAGGAALTVQQYHQRMDTSRSRIGYVDLTFSAPKSVSVAWAFAPTEAERGIIQQAHRDAIGSVMAEIERHIGRARKGKAGRDGWEQGAIGWVSFDHCASRPTVAVVRQDRAGRDYTELHTVKGAAGRMAGDMQLHTHVATFNAALTASGRLGGLWLDQLDGRVKEWGALYQAYLATNLRRHGVEVGLDERTEMARLAAIPARVTEHFSKRTVGGAAAARAYAAEQGLDWDSLDPERKIGLLKQGVQNPRGAKSDDLGDAAAWRRAATEIGYCHRSVLRPDGIPAEKTRDERLDGAYRAALPVFEKELRRRASVAGEDARVAAAKGLIAAGVASPADVDAVTRSMRERGVAQYGAMTRLIWGDAQGRNGRAKVGITTALHESEEQDLVDHARAAGRDTSAALSPRQIADAVARHPELDLSSAHGRAQRAAIEALGGGGRLAVAIGVAGSGKTTMLKPLVTAWRDAGRAVHGIALAWRQADDLTDAGIARQNTRAFERFARDLETGRLTLDQHSVVVVDELGLIGTRQLGVLLRTQRIRGFQVVALGDPKQMQSIEAGDVIGLLRRGLGDDAVPEITTSVRQLAAEERETALMFRHGQTEEAVMRKAGNGTLRVVPGDYDDAVAGVVWLWEERRAANPGREGYAITISTPTNADAHTISLAVRSRRRARGEIGADRRVVPATDGDRSAPRTYDMTLAEGDRVRLFTRTNARFLDSGALGNIGQNGSVLTVAAVRDDGLVLRTQAGRAGLARWDSLRHPGNGRLMLAYGDVLTTHTSQGATVDEHIFAMPAGSRPVNAFGAYTAGSRHREASWIVTSDGAERAEIAGRRPLGDRRPVRESDVLANITRNFARQPEKESALALLERMENIRLGGVRHMQAAKQGLQRRHAAGQQRSTLGQAFARRRDANAAREAAPELAATTSRGREMAARLHHLGAEVRRSAQAAVERADAARRQIAERIGTTRRRGVRL